MSDDHHVTKRPPYTVWLYVAGAVAVLAYILLFGRIDGWLFAGGGLLLLAAYAFVRGSRWAWLFLVVVHGGSLALAVFRGPDVSPIVVNGCLLALLLARPTREHARVAADGAPR